MIRAAALCLMCLCVWQCLFDVAASGLGESANAHLPLVGACASRQLEPKLHSERAEVSTPCQPVTVASSWVPVATLTTVVSRAVGSIPTLKSSRQYT